MRTQTYSTQRFVAPWAYVSASAVGLVIVAAIASVFVANPLGSTTIQVSEGEPRKLQPIPLKQQNLGALRVDVKAMIPVGRWVTYEIQLLDQQNQVVAAGIKQAWHESGTWYEDGQSGTWQESDLQGGLDIRAEKAEPITVAVQVLEYSTTSNQEIDQPISFEINLTQGAIDSRYLWTGFIGTTLLTLLTFGSVNSTGKKVIDRAIGDSDVGDRALMGGDNQLIKLTIKVNSDETTRGSLTANLFIKDGQGQQIYTKALPLKLSHKREEDGTLESVMGHAQLFLVLEPRSSYGFYVEVTPDQPVDSTRLMVREGVRTLRVVEVVKINAT